MLGEVPTSVEQFSKVVLPTMENETTGGLTVALLNQLREFQKHLADYRALLSSNEKQIEREEILRYVSQHNPDGDEKYQNYRAVRLVEIYTRFPLAEVSSIALADLPGLDEIKEGEAQRLIKSLAQDVDMVLFVKLPAETGGAWIQQDMNLYTLAKEALLPIDLAKCSFMVLNRHSNGNNTKLCHEMQKGAKQHGIHTQDVVVANCFDPIEAQEKILLPVLDYMAKNIQAIDDEYLNAKREEILALKSEIEIELNAVKDVLKKIGISDSDAKINADLFRNFKKQMIQLGKYVNKLELIRDNKDELLNEALENACKSAKEDNSLPTEEQLNDDVALSMSWDDTYYHFMHLMRNKLTWHFQKLDDSLHFPIKKMKKDIVEILKNAGLSKLASENSNEEEFLQALICELESDKEYYQQLYDGIKNFSEFKMSYRGFIQHRIRRCLNELTPNLTTHKLPSDVTNENVQPEVLQGRLLDAYEESLSAVKTELTSILKEPGMARYAIVEEFRDQIWKAGNTSVEREDERDAEEQWKTFLDERKERLLPEKFMWQKLLNNCEKQLGNLA